MLRILGYAGSINVRKVLWACAELDLEYAREDWAGGTRPTSDPRFLALNPMAMVPVIDDDGFVLAESNAIIRYLAASRGSDALLPAEPRRRAEIEMWMDWQASDFNNAWRVAFQGLVRRNPEHRDAGAIERSMTEFSRLVGIVEARLEQSGGYICGARFTLADIPIGLAIHRWRGMPAAKPELPGIERYYDRLCERPGFQRYGRDGGP